jgi:hypothetical protein
MILNKKGVGFALPRVYSYLAVFFLLVIFALIFLTPFVIDEKEEKILLLGEISSKENVFVLNAYLNTPVSDSQSVSDLINLWLLDSSNEEELRTVSEEIFSGVYGSCYGLSLDDIELGNVGSDRVCIDYPNFGEMIEICLDISEYDEKLESGGVEECI